MKNSIEQSVIIFVQILKWAQNSDKQCGSWKMGRYARRRSTQSGSIWQKSSFPWFLIIFIFYLIHLHKPNTVLVVSAPLLQDNDRTNLNLNVNLNLLSFNYNLLIHFVFQTLFLKLFLLNYFAFTKL